MSNPGALVYVVDDDPYSRDGVADLIRSAGLIARTFASGEEFLTVARHEPPPGCLVLDVHLPGVSGLDVQQELIHSEVQVPIIFLTGNGDVPMTVRAVKAGAVNVLTKPFDEDVLLNAVRQCLTPIVSGSSPVSASSPIRILAVDDHPLVRDGIAGLVAAQPDMMFVGQAANGCDAIQQFRTHRPDVTLMDIHLPGMNGLDALIAIRSEFPEARVIVLTTSDGDVHIRRALKAGAQGYLFKNTLHSELLHSIRAVHAGKRSLSPEASFQVAEHMSDETLTPAEVVVLRLIAAGQANKEIADQLGLTEDTVKGRVKSVLAKLEANDRTHAAIIGLKRGIIEL